MYDMYPEWGPAKNNPDSPTQHTRPSRPRLTCETTAASARTTTSLVPCLQSAWLVEACRHPGRRDRDRGHRRGTEGARAGRRPTGVKFEPTRYDLGAERYLATGEVLPDSVLEEIRQHDVILLGAVGGKPNDPNLPPGILERGLLLRLRFELDHYVNLRPSRIFPGARLAARRPGRGRLRRRTRGHRGSLHRQRRRAARRYAARDRHRGLGEHRLRRGAGRPRRVPPGPEAPRRS